MVSPKVLYIIFLSILLPTSKGNQVDIVERECYDEECYHGGHCEQESCVCPPGWEGNYCQHCQGRFLVDKESGTIQDGEYQQGHFNDCGWLIQLNPVYNEPNSTLHLVVDNASVACSGDFLYVYDGDGMHSPLLAVFDGVAKYYQPVTGNIVASSGKAFLHFKSESEIRMDGYTVSYRFGQDAPELPSNEGPFSSMNSYGWTEYFWENLTTQGRASAAVAINNQNIYVFGGYFLGEVKYQQQMLKFNDSSREDVVSSWRVDVVSSSSGPSPRFGHTMISFKDQLIVHGGLITDTYSISNEIWSFNTTNNQWSQVFPPGEAMTTSSPHEMETTPSPDSHTTLPLVDISSASLPDGNISKNSFERSNELFGTSSATKDPQKKSPHTTMDPVFTPANGTDNRTSQTPLNPTSPSPMDSTSPPPLFGHTSHFVQLRNGQNVMITLFGYHPRWGISNFVFEYDLDNSTWTRVETSGAIPHGGYGHASVHDEVNNLIYVHGGLKGQSSYEDEMLIYDVERKLWSTLAPAFSRFLHSMVLINGSLLIYGGRSLQGHDMLCADVEFMKYDIATDSWKELGLYIFPSYSRFGHVGLTLSNNSPPDAKMIVYGGYDGTMLSDVMTYVMDSSAPCSEMVNETSCDSPHCHWKDGICEDLSCAEGEELAAICQSFCSSFSTCSGCLSTGLSCCDCSFCPDCYQSCFFGSDNSSFSNISQCLDDTERMKLLCMSFTNCEQCNVVDGCTWTGRRQCEFGDSPSSECPPSCLEQTNCSVCLSVTGCGWCETTGTCIDQSSTDVFYPYGTCTDWRTEECGDPCLSHISCDDCSTDVGCGWCATDADTGTGTCMSGSNHAPLSSMSCSVGNWFFISCPECQCNGHSFCLEGSDVCNNCTDHTIGETCEMCDQGYYGYPLNGANCSECECNGHADDCDNAGRCYCRVNGMTGKNCDGCYESLKVKYYGDPKNGSCYYNIQVQYRYNFPISDSSQVSEMNFESCPIIRDDILMKIESEYGVLFDVDVRYNYTGAGNTSLPEQLYKSYENQTYLSLIFRQDEFKFGGQPRCCLRIYLRFKAPFYFYISLERTQNYLSLLLGVFFASFLILLIIALAWWKLHDLIYRFRSRRRREIELQEMAARPFATVNFDFNEIPKMDHSLAVIAEEPSMDEKVSVVSVLMQMPGSNASGSSDRETHLSLGSALIASATVRTSTNERKSKKKGKLCTSREPTGFLNLAIDLENDLGRESSDSSV